MDDCHRPAAMSALHVADDPTRPTLEAVLASGKTFVLPWGRARRTLLTGFDGRRIKDPQGPWRVACPFSITPRHAHAIIADGLGGTSSFHDHQSTSAETSNSHLSLNGGLTVGYPFLNVGADVNYDRTVMQNENGMNTSRTSSSLVGRIILDQCAELSPLALSVLRQEGGREKFRAAYGDYYVCGLELGAHAAACLSVTTKTASTKERTKIAVRAKVLFFEAKAEVSTIESQSAQFEGNVCFVSYNTIDPRGDRTCTVAAQTLGDVMGIKNTVDSVLDGVASLDSTIRKQMQELGISDGAAMGPAACNAVFDRGLDVGLVMAPFDMLEVFVQERQAKLMNMEDNFGLTETPSQR